jgi:16S rRNA (cytosine1402-N4)-methyltransferase
MEKDDFEYHSPVMLEECMDGLAIKPDGTYLDCTLGGGGHFRSVASRLNSAGTAVALDRDTDAVLWVKNHPPQTEAKTVIALERFSNFDSVLRNNNITKVDGILMDLGISSHQIDDKERGFAYMGTSPLDMRMDRRLPVSASEILSSEDETELTRILGEYGEVGNPGRMAAAIVRYRRTSALGNSDDLRACLESEYGVNMKIKVLAKVFQALRIAVNEELRELTSALEKSVDALSRGGRLVVLSYHSLEDRIVKTFIRREENPCTCPTDTPRCICGKVVKFKRVNRKPITASSAEISSNPRARSARLRVAEKIC